MSRSRPAGRTDTAPTELRSDRDEGDRRDGVVTGAVAGLFASVLMIGFRVPISRSPPSSANFWARYLGEESGEPALGPGLFLHLLYGTIAGAVFGAGVTPRLSGSDTNRERSAALAGIVYGASLSLFGRIVLLDWLLDLDLDADERFVFHVSHLVYGVALGTFLGSAD